MRTYLSLAVAACCACAAGPPPVVAAIEPELVTFDAEAISDSIDSLGLAMPWQLTNPLGNPVTVQRIEWQLQAGEWGERGVVEANVAVAGGQLANERLVVRVPLPQAVPAITPYVVTATFDVSGGQEVAQFEAEWRGVAVLPQVPSVTLEPQAGRHGSDTVELNFVVGMTNTNAFDVRIDRLTYRLMLEGVEVGAGALVQDHRLRATSTLEFQVGRVVALKELPPARQATVRGGQLHYDVAVAAVLAGKPIERTFTGQLTFEAR